MASTSIPSATVEPQPGLRRPPGHHRRRSPYTLWRYVAREFFLPLTCSICGFILLFVVLDIFDVLQDLMGAQAPLSQVTLYFLLRQPANLIQILPMSLLLSAGYITSNFLRHHELTAIRGAGISLFQGLMPIWLAGGLGVILSFGLSEYVAPEAMRVSQRIFEKMTEAVDEDVRSLVRLAFRNSAAHRDWFFERYEKNGEQTGVWIKQFRPDLGIQWELRADRAVYRDGHWTFFDVTRIEYDPDSRLPRDNGVHHDEFTPDDFDESPGEILNSLRPLEDLSVRDMILILNQPQELPRSTRDVFLTTIWYRCVFPFTCILAVLLGVTLSVTRQGGSRLRGFSLAIALLVVYTLISHMFVLLGKNGLMPPWLAASCPMLLFTGWSGWDLFRKR